MIVMETNNLQTQILWTLLFLEISVSIAQECPYYAPFGTKDKKCCRYLFSSTERECQPNKQIDPVGTNSKCCSHSLITRNSIGGGSNIKGDRTNKDAFFWSNGDCYSTGFVVANPAQYTSIKDKKRHYKRLMKFLDIKPSFISDEIKNVIDQQIPTSYGCLIACLIQGPELCKIWSYSIKIQCSLEHNTRYIFKKNKNEGTPSFDTLTILTDDEPNIGEDIRNITFRESFQNNILFDVAVFGRPYSQHTKCNITYDRQNYLVRNAQGFTDIGNIKMVDDFHSAKDCQEHCSKQASSNSWIFTQSESCICRSRSMSAYELYPSMGSSTGIAITKKIFLNMKPAGRVKLVRLRNVNLGECAFYFQTFDPYGYLSNQVSTFFSYVPKARLCYLGEAKQDKTMIHMIENQGTITGTKTSTYKMDGAVQTVSYELGDEDYGANSKSLCLVPDELKVSCSDDYNIKKAECSKKNCCFNPYDPIKCFYEFDMKANLPECVGKTCTSECFNGQTLYLSDVHDIRGYHIIPPYLVFAYRNDTGIPISEARTVCETVDFTILWPDLKNGGYTDKMITFMKCAHSKFTYNFDEFYHKNRKPAELRVIMCLKRMDTSVKIFSERFALDTNKTEYIKPKHTKGKHMSSGCFSGDSWVTTLFRGSIPIGDLKLGDEVFSHCRDTKCYYSRIIHVGKNSRPEDFSYIQIRLENGQKLKLSHTHFLMVYKDEFSDLKKYVWAKNVHLFEYLPIIYKNRTSRSKIVQFIHKRGSEAFHNPITESGLITVNKITASVYAVAPGFIYKSNEISGHEFAHFLYLIANFLKNYLPISSSNELQEGMDSTTYFITRRFEPVLYQMLDVKKGNSTYIIPGIYWISLRMAIDFYKY